MIPGDGLQAIVAGLKNHRRLGRFSLDRVERDLNLAAGVDPMAEQCSRSVARVFRNGCCAVRTQAQVHGRSNLRGAARMG